MKDIIIVDKNRLKKTLEGFKKDGMDNLHVLADFDRTLTKAFYNGEKRHSLIHTLEARGYLGKEFSRDYKKNFDYYYPIEIDPNISIEEKSKKMLEWWKKTNELLIKNKLNKNDIRKIINEGIIKFRYGAKDFFENLGKKDIPLVVISASGLGDESINIFFKYNNISLDNIFVISNKFIHEKNGYAIGYKKPVIHTFNKDETVLKDFPEIYKNIKNRKNVILLGDSLGDIGMINGFDYKNLLKIGFLNDKKDELLDSYKKNYDVIITGDGDFDFVNKILEDIKG